MLLLKMRQAEVPERHVAAQVADAVAGSQDRFVPLLDRALQQQADSLGFTRVPLAEPSTDGLHPPGVVWAELFSDGVEVVALTVQEGERRAVEVSGGGRLYNPVSFVRLHGIGSSGAADLLKALAKALGEHLGVEFEPFRYVSQRFEELRDEEGMSPSVRPTEDEQRAAQLLADGAVRTGAVAIASSGGLLVRDFPKQFADEETERAEEVTQALQGAGLVTSELLVMCRRTSAQVARVPSHEAIDAAAETGLRCPACGRGIADERAEEALALTDHGRSMLDGSRWLSVLLATELIAVGVEPERMLIEQTAGGDESDCLADISGELVFFELKDKEFSLGNAYSFGSKVAVFRPDLSVVVTTAHVGNDAKEHFEKARAPGRDRFRYAPRTASARSDRTGDVIYVEGIETLAADLRAIAEQIYVDDAATVLQDVLPGAALSPRKTVEALKEVQPQPTEQPRSVHDPQPVEHPQAVDSPE